MFTKNVVISVDASQAEDSESGRIFCCVALHRLDSLKT